MSKGWIFVIVVIILFGGLIYLSNNGSLNIDDTGTTPTEEEEKDSDQGDNTNPITPPAETPKNPPPTSSEDDGQLKITVGTAVVTYTEDGFEPNTVLIEQRNSVRFINQSGRAMRIMSYPENAYNSFAQSASVGNGGEFVFSFTRTGRFEYYDKNNPEYRGTVMVYSQVN